MTDAVNNAADIECSTMLRATDGPGRFRLAGLVAELCGHSDWRLLRGGAGAGKADATPGPQSSRLWAA